MAGTHLGGRSLLPQLHYQQLVHPLLQLLGEVTNKGVLAERLVDHEHCVPHDVAPPSVIRKVLALKAVICWIYSKQLTM